MEIKSAKVLLEKYREGTCTKEECTMVEEWYATWNEDDKSLSDERLDNAVTRIYDRFQFV